MIGKPYYVPCPYCKLEFEVRYNGLHMCPWCNKEVGVELTHKDVKTLEESELAQALEKLTVEDIKCLLNRKMRID